MPHSRAFIEATTAFIGGTDDPRKFLERCIETVASLEPDVGAFVSLNLERARAAADASAQRWKASRPLSAIDGMPIGIKDVIETADMPTENGSPLFSGWTTGRDAACVAALREAGAIIVGKTVTTEFAVTVPGKTVNPWDRDRTPGGSSSGSAAAAATGMVCAALGTQVVGSILRPASYCGCVGYKPSAGAINRGGCYDYGSQSCVGVLAATLDDAWTVLFEIAQRVGGDPGCFGLAGVPLAARSRKPSRLGLLHTAGWDRATSDAKHALASVVSMLQSQGVTIATREHDSSLEHFESVIAPALPLSLRIITWESRWPLNTYARDMDRNKLSSVIQARLQAAETMTLDEYRAALAERDAIRRSFEVLSGGYDGFLTLATPGPAPTGLQSTGDPVFAVVSSLLGAPAVSLPVLESEGLPLGLQLLGFRGLDQQLFQHARWVGEALQEGVLTSTSARSA